jgi:hypothetical protein
LVSRDNLAVSNQDSSEVSNRVSLVASSAIKLRGRLFRTPAKYTR